LSTSLHLSHRLLLSALIPLTIALLSSCHRSPAKIRKHFPFTGRIVSIDLQDQLASIHNDLIPGVMDPMDMMYKIKPPEILRQLSPGDSISADFIIIDAEDESGGNQSWLENVRITGHAKQPPVLASNSLHLPAPGEEVPNFSFTNQNGRRIWLSQYRGKTLLVTFIYTRCPFPDFCPRMSNNFAEIYKQLSGHPALAGVHLLSISFDPEHDTPRVLRDYGFSVAHTHDAALFKYWEFAAPPTADLPKIQDFFALTVKPEGGMITHNLSTAVIGPEGKIISWYHGSDWQVSDLMKDASAARAQRN
jgi:protein SCO1